jgi:hypothetical protein
MTCEPERDEYIEAVSDVVEVTKYLAAFTEQYLEKVKGRPAPELGTDEWRMYTECLERLVREQRAAYVRYKNRSRLHIGPGRYWLSAKTA